MDRRTFLKLSVGSSAGALLTWTPNLLSGATTVNWDPRASFSILGRPLKVQPVFMYALSARKEQASWRSWGGVQTESDVAAEVARIANENTLLTTKAEFGIEMRPLARVTSPEVAEAIAGRDQDVTVVYACTGTGSLLRACLGGKGHKLIFVRHQSGPIYYWYEALSTRYLQKEGTGISGDANLPNLHVDDVVVDDCAELLWRLRALFALKNLPGTRIVALGGPWGKYAEDAPEKAKERFGLKIIDVSYKSFAPRLRQARGEQALVSAAEKATARYLALPGTKLLTDRRAVINAFVLYQVFKELMLEHDATAFTESYPCRRRPPVCRWNS